MSLRRILAEEGLVKQAAPAPAEMMRIIDRAGGDVTHMHAGTWATFRNQAVRNKVYDELTNSGFTNVVKEGRTDIRLT